MGIVKTTAAVAVTAAALGGGSLALAASSPKGGKVQVFVSGQSPNGGKAKILVTGAIGDYGKTISTDKNGKVDPNGNYQLVKLTKGTFVVNATAFDKKLSQNHGGQLNRSTCSIVFGGSGPGTVGQGTGAYAGVSGKVTITATFAGIQPRYTSGPHKGQCNLSPKAHTHGQYEAITAAGHVSFH